jgi:cytochrome c
MPMNVPGSLTNDEVYSISAYLLYLNRIISEDTQLNAENLKNVVMPARDKFINDDRLNFKIAH